MEKLPHHLRDRLGGNAEHDEVRPPQVVLVGAEQPHSQVARQLDPREVALVVARPGELLRLVEAAGEQRGAQAAPLEQKRHGRAEGARADDGDTADMLAR